MIFGTGIDAQEISAVQKLVERRPRFVDVILTANERAVFDERKGKHQWEYLAGRFSLKEAYSKAIGTGIGSAVHWHDLETDYTAQGAPVLVKHPYDKQYQAHISISHTGDSVHTSVILEDMASLTQPVSSHRPAWLEISASALAHNVAYIKELAHAERFMAVVKANAYGHGLPEIVTAALAAQVDGFAVATLDEGVWLRHFGVTLPIYILGVTPANQANILAEQQLTAIVPSLNWLNEALAALTVTQKLPVSIGVDTGMGRIGIRDEAELLATVQTLQAAVDKVDFQAIGMHFATADGAGTDQAYFEKQMARWHALVDPLDLPATVIKHQANSASALWHDQVIAHDMVRVGAGMYGFDASSGVLEARATQPVLSLKAELVHVKQVAAGESISYGATYTTTEPTWIGTVPVGYADGYARLLQGADVLLPDGQRAPIIGRVTMDQLLIALPAEYPVGTVITLIGRVGQEEITLVDLADRLGTIPYEVATGLSPRLPRRIVN